MTVYDHVKSHVISHVLHNTVSPESRYEDAALSTYSSRLSFFLSTMADPDFDPLTPTQDDTHANLQRLRYILKTESWILTTELAIHKQRPVFSFNYHESIHDLLDPLLTGKITPELHCVLEKMEYNGWDRGCVQAVVNDLRYSEPQTFTIRLHSSGAATLLEKQEFIEQNTDVDDLEVERLMLLATRPNLCTDPSPEVARYWSAVDWRRKMWRSSPNHDRPPPQITPVPPANVPRIEQHQTQRFDALNSAHQEWASVVEAHRANIVDSRKQKPMPTARPVQRR